MGAFFGRLLLFLFGAFLTLGGLFLIVGAIISLPFIADKTNDFWLVGLVGFVAMATGSFITRFALHG